MITKSLKITFATILMVLGLFVAFTVPGELVKILGIFLAFPTLLGIIFSFLKNKKFVITGKVFFIIISVVYLLLFYLLACGTSDIISDTARIVIVVLGIITAIITFILTLLKESKIDDKIELISQPRIKTLIGNILLCCLFGIAAIFAFVFILKCCDVIQSFHSISSNLNVHFTSKIVFVILILLASIIGFVFTLANFKNYKYTNKFYMQYKPNTILSFVCTIIVSLCSFYYMFVNSALFIFIGIITILGLVTGSVLVMIDFYKVVTKNRIDDNKKEIDNKISSTAKSLSSQQPSKESFETKLANLFKLKKAGALTEEEYKSLKKKLIEKTFK